MSATTVQKMVYRVRQLLRDFNPTDPKFFLPEILDALDRAMFVVHSDLPGRSTLNTGFITLVNGTYSYTLSESNPFSLESFRLTSNGNPVERRSLSELLAYRTGNPDATGDPLIIAFSEAASGTVTAYVWPTPSKSDTIEAVVDTMISSVFQGIASSDLSATSLNFGPYGTRAIEYMAAAELSKDKDFMATAQKMAHNEAVRIASLEAGSGEIEPVI